jgi:hypothetical protein
LQQTVQSKQSPNGRKFAQSGHPAKETDFISLKRDLCQDLFVTLQNSSSIFEATFFFVIFFVLNLQADDLRVMDTPSW